MTVATVVTMAVIRWFDLYYKPNTHRSRVDGIALIQLTAAYEKVCDGHRIPSTKIQISYFIYIKNLAQSLND